ncbi:MAG: ABC transporter ATP-binding protein [Calditrichaceae bacterium]
MEERILEVSNVRKSFSDNLVIDNLSFKVKGGETFGLLGPNGAGKTTMMRMIMNMIIPDEGEILYNGKPRRKHKSLHFGYLPEERGLYPRATVLEMLVYFGTLSNLTIRKAEVEAIRYLDRLGIVEFTDTRVNQLSKGMQQKIQFIAAFLHNPDVLILDEPFAGLDPINQIVLRDILNEYKNENKILILSTHQMDHVEKLCDHICLMNQGQVILDGSMGNIKKYYRENAYSVEADNSLSFLHELDEISILEENSNAYKFKMKPANGSVSNLIAKISQKARIKKFEVVEPSLHDIFLKLIQDKNK